MPVPSTMTGFRLTIVGILWGRVASAQPFIITGGPIATHSSMSGCFSMARRMPSVTMPLIPAEPSSVQTISSSQQAPNLSSQKTRSRFRKPSTPIT